MNQELLRYPSQVTSELQIQNQRQFDNIFWNYPAQQLVTALVEAVEDHFLTTGSAVEAKGRIIDYVKRARGVFAEQIKTFQAEAIQLEPSPATQQKTFSALVRTFIHDYVVTPTGIPGHEAPADANERDVIVTEIFQDMGGNLRSKLTQEGAKTYLPR